MLLNSYFDRPELFDFLWLIPIEDKNFNAAAAAAAQQQCYYCDEDPCVQYFHLIVKNDFFIKAKIIALH